MSASIERYHQAFDMSQALLDIAEVDDFPIDIPDFISKKKGAPVLISTLEDYNAWTNLKNPENWVPLFVLDAKCFYYSDLDAYIIVYNEVRPEKRIRFSLVHELAHIVLGHLDDERTEISRGGIDDPTYYAMEGAANTFAGNFLAPPILIENWLSRSAFDVASVSIRFNISASSVRDYRAEDYTYWKTIRPSIHEKSILRRCQMNLHRRKCGICGGIFSIKAAEFCPICGSRSVTLCQGVDQDMGRTYDGVKLDAQGRSIECPICKNEEHLDKADFCMICGKTIFNRCCDAIVDDCYRCEHSEPLPGNARFCPFCGSQTTFLRDGLLLPWAQVEPPKSTDFSILELEDGDPLPF